MKKPNPFQFSDNAKRYHTYDYAMRQKFGGKIARICLDAGMSCPNIENGGGCVYCSGSGSGDFAGDKDLSIREQLIKGMTSMSQKWHPIGHIAYFQAHTNTYTTAENLARLYEEALSVDGIIGIAVATRPDCLGDDICEILEHFSKRTYFTVELGLQTIHANIGARIRRGHTTDDFLCGYNKLARRNIPTGVHLINGLPDESREMMLETAKFVGALHPHLIKLHMLYVIENTTLAAWYHEGKVPLLSREQYVETICAQLELIPPQTIIGRLTGDGASDTLLAPQWSRKKLCVLNEIDKFLAKNNTFQGNIF